MTSKELMEKYLSGTCMYAIGACKEELKQYKEEGIDITAKFTDYEVIGDQVTLKYWCNACEEEEVVVEQSARDWVYIGECPSEESTDLAKNQYHVEVLRRQMKAILKRHYGNPPDGARLAIRYEGGFCTLVCHYDTLKPLSVAFAYMAEDLLPKKWSQAALTYMKGLSV